MNLDDLVDLLKSRECEAVWYFHTDHFEPWSYDIDDDSARAVERFAAMARSSRYARKLSLFYSVFIPYRLATGGNDDGGASHAPGDSVLFGGRSPRQEALAREVIRPLLDADEHEIHLHVHHEYWTRNTSDFDSPVSRWVNQSSTPDLDRSRLDLYFRRCNEVIGRELGRPFERWAFVHGNWALNASDPRICQVEDEIAMMMRHGGWGDFSFPAGRGYCDPKLEAPFTCLPLVLPRVYDDPAADPRPIGEGTGLLSRDRFFIWNSPIKANFSSIDYYSPANCQLFKTPERVVQEWLAKSVVLDRRLFLKTHAHSMKWEYKIAEPGSVIPHCYPDVVRIFDQLARACDRAGVELKLVTVSEVMAALQQVDGGNLHLSAAGSGGEAVAGTNMATVLDAPPLSSIATIARDARGDGGPDEREVEKLEAITELGSGSPRYVLKPPFVADGGQAWTAALPEELHLQTDSDNHPARSSLILLEERMPLGPAHALHQRIRSEGRGLYSFWKTGLWFSTSDGSNPNTNGRLYSVAPDPDAPPLRFPEPSAAAEAAPERPNVAASDALAQVFPLRRGAEVLYRVFGERRLTRCPVCNGGDATQLWRIPMANIDPPISLFGGYFNQVPTLQVPGVVFCFDFCPDCESIFLNPVPASQKQEYRDTDHYIRKMETAAEWQGYEDVYDSFAKWIPSEATVMVDAACGIGQYLHVARRRGTHNWRRMIGLELAEKYVDRMRAEGFEAHAFDIDNDDLSVLVAPNSIDFITFSEAFEHVERPLDALRKLAGALRPGGRLYFSAQRYGRDVQAAVRPAEPIYIGEKVVKEMPDRLGCRIVDIRTSSMRYFIVLEK